ncbi:uncharacterized protein LOC8059901 [Sorghum bicolor]|uniref:uncharacterized protein LOC8059901 n=1 Tax=Sorghum bicolor TaxID=4558 RepID=UPI000B42479B|nr:uncharacterized protein LOC8059901 [Sorghum bicolor]|eukprot:XP_002461396.2 uncharacterized protein LOC8059901 [Sorghum bicolor]
MAVSSSAEPDHHHQLMDVVAAAAPKAVVEQTVPLAFAVAAPPSNLPASSVPNASAARTTNLSGESSSAQSVHDDAMETVVALGLGGHSVGHKHRERELLVVPGGRRRDKRERVHVCSDCGAEFATGVQLGGHKRKHWAGAPICISAK